MEDKNIEMEYYYFFYVRENNIFLFIRIVYNKLNLYEFLWNSLFPFFRESYLFILNASLSENT